jgi:DNA-binding winged helix-turn-helix (wHTH) protein
LEPLRQTSVVRFGTYEIRLQSGELRKSGLRIKVQQQPLRLLEILLERPGEIVTREELRSRMWPNENFGDFDQAVNVAIAKLRAALGDTADNPRFVETLPRRGYRFLADVSVANPPPQALAPPSEDGSSSSQSTARIETEKPPHPKWVALTTLATMMVLLLSTLSWIFLHKSGTRTDAVSPSTVSSSLVSSLAVLPLENLSTGSEDYFADGMTDELITDLAQISALRVISRTSIMSYIRSAKTLSADRAGIER